MRWFRGRTRAGGSSQALGPTYLSEGDYFTVYLFICITMTIIFSTSDNRIPLSRESTKELPVLGRRHFDVPYKDGRLEMAGAPKAKTES